MQYPQIRILAITLLVRFSFQSSDSSIIQRIIPSILKTLSDDSSSAVRSVAIRALCSLLHNVTQVTSVEAQIFPNYIFPGISALCKDAEVMVRLALAESLG